MAFIPDASVAIVLRTLSVTSNSLTFFVANSQPCRSLVDCVTDGCVSSPCARIVASCAEAGHAHENRKRGHPRHEQVSIQGP